MTEEDSSTESNSSIVLTILLVLAVLFGIFMIGRVSVTTGPINQVKYNRGEDCWYILLDCGDETVQKIPMPVCECEPNTDPS